jgi:Kef-type K+ transport system membrane component KefB/mannitol/fructose-specific phosphotransferase system IIA component (Ntr-type)
VYPGEYMRFWLILIFLVGTALLLADTSAQESLVERMPNLVMQLGILIFAARIGASAVEKFGIPGVLGELVIGILIGPYMLGSIPIPGFPHGFFASSNAAFPIQPELYGIAIIASIILLFNSGLETDLQLLIRFSLAGTVIGIGGILFSFFIGTFTAMYFMHLPLMDPKCLFLGIMSTATSVGITARVLSERKRMDSPEGVTILAAAVIDDVLGIVLLAIVLGISLVVKTGNQQALNWSHIMWISFKEIGLWLGVMIVGLALANRFSSFLKVFKNRGVFSILAFSIALVIAGLFERAGLAMIIGAYVVGLTLSKTEISFAIQEALDPLIIFFVPVFFTVMGMLVNVRELFTTGTLIFGLVYTVGAILAKYLGCGLPALALKFNVTGAQRIGLGMIPRGEVALIIAGIGLSYGLIKDPNYDIFSIGIMMTLFTTLISPPLLQHFLKSPKAGTRNADMLPEKDVVTIHLVDNDVADLLVHKILQQFKSMGFFINQLDSESGIYQMRKQKMAISMVQEKSNITLQTDCENGIFVERMVHEAAFYLKQTVTGILNLEDMHAPLEEELDNKKAESEMEKLIKKEHVIPCLKAETKEGVVWEMLQCLKSLGKIKDIKKIYYIVMEREKYLSGGLTHGIAIPHAHSDDISEPLVVVGIKRDGLDFLSIDRKPAFLIILILTPTSEASIHIRMLARIAHLSRNIKNVNLFLENEDVTSIRDFIINNCQDEVNNKK